VSVELRGAIFDLDGTIAETHPMAIDLIGETISRFGGGDLTPDELVSLFGPNEKGIFRRAVGPSWESAWQFYRGEYLSRHEMCPRPFPGIPDLLERLRDRGLHLGVVTGKTAETGALSLEVLGLTRFFPDLLGGAMDRVTKRDDITAMVVRWGIPPEQAVYVGDTPGDVVEARAAGVVALAACWSAFSDPSALAAEDPDQVFASVEDMSVWFASASPGRPG
jgi:phosphoglycolate phosphatase-like HAD superfamily hydrolase